MARCGKEAVPRCWRVLFRLLPWIIIVLLVKLFWNFNKLLEYPSPEDVNFIQASWNGSSSDNTTAPVNVMSLDITRLAPTPQTPTPASVKDGSATVDYESIEILKCERDLADCVALQKFEGEVKVWRRTELFQPDANGAVPPFHWEGEAPSLAVFRNVYVSLLNGWIYDANRSQVVTHRMCNLMGATQSKLEGNVTYLPTQVFQAEKAIHLTSLWSNAFYHNLVEQLPRLMAVVDIMDSNMTIIGKPRAAGYFNIFSDFFEEKTRLIHNGRRDGLAFVDTLYVPETIGCMSSNAPLSQAFRSHLRQWLATQGSLNSTNRSQVTVIHRENSREILNHEELVAELRKLPVDVVEFRDSALPKRQSEQMAIFASSTVILGPHGAGLSWILAAPPSAMVFEFQFPSRAKCYEELSSALNLTYHSQQVTVDADNGEKGTVNVNDVIPTVKNHLDIIRSKDISNRRLYEEN